MSERDWNGETYHRVSNPQLVWGRGVLARLELRGDEIVLDAGCGTGRLTAELVERVPRGRVVGIDVSESMLTVARSTTAWARRRFDVVRATITAMPFDGSADVVFSAATFHWVPDHPRLFRELYRVLRPGGRLEAQCGGGANLRRVHGRAAALMKSEPFEPFFRDWVQPWEFADAPTTASRLREAGFVEVETSLQPAPTTFADAQAYREFVEPVVARPFLARLPDASLRDGFLDALAREAARDEPPWTLDYWRLNLRGARPPAGARARQRFA